MIVPPQVLPCWNAEYRAIAWGHTDAGHTRVHIGAGAASVAIRVPSGVAGRIRVKGGLAGIAVDKGRFPRMGDVYQSTDYDTAPNKVDVDIETGVGSVDVR